MLSTMVFFLSTTVTECMQKFSKKLYYSKKGLCNTRKYFKSKKKKIKRETQENQFLIPDLFFIIFKRNRLHLNLLNIIAAAESSLRYFYY